MKKKLLLFFLSAVSAVCLAFGVTACSDDGSLSDWDNGIFTVETAYAEAQDLGYSGTLQEFIASISGTNGTGISSVKLNEDGELVITLTDNTQLNLGVIKGEDGADGEDGSTWYNGTYEAMSSVTANEGDYYLTTDTYAVYTYTSEGWTLVIESIKGEDGDEGDAGKDGTSVTITNIAENKDDDGNVISTTITFSDGNSVTITNGTNGTDGEDGSAGAAGADGKDGTSVTITNIAENKDSDGNVISTTITFSDGNTVTVTNGTDGEDGEDGSAGKDGTSVTITNTTTGTDDNGTYTEVTFSNGSSIKVYNGTDGSAGANGKDGADGSTWYNGTYEAMSSVTANEGDYYLTTDTYAVYTYTSGSWELIITSLKGTDGTDGSKGDTGADGADGENGKDGTTLESVTPNYDTDGKTILSYTVTYSDGTSFTIYNGTNGSDGQTGAAGSDGEDGADGATWYTGTEKERSEVNAKEGDLYLATDTYAVYKYTTADGWTKIIDSLKGEDGKDGADGSSSTATETTVTVIFDYNDGSGICESITVTKGDSIADLPEPTRDGYTFAGWYSGTGVNAGQVTDVTPISRDMTLIAKWEECESLTISYLYSDYASDLYYCNSITAETDTSVSFKGYYSATFTEWGDYVMPVTIVANGIEYAVDNAISYGIIGDYYIYNYSDGSFSGWIYFTQSGEYIVYLTYEDATTYFTVTVKEWEFSGNVCYSYAYYNYGVEDYYISETYLNNGDTITGYTLADYYSNLRVVFYAPKDSAITVNATNKSAGTSETLAYTTGYNTGWLFVYVNLDTCKNEGTYLIDVTVDSAYGSASAEYSFEVTSKYESYIVLEESETSLSVGSEYVTVIALIYTSTMTGSPAFTVADSNGYSVSTYYINESNYVVKDSLTCVYYYFYFTAEGSYTVTVTCDSATYTCNFVVSAISFSLGYLSDTSIYSSEYIDFDLYFYGELYNDDGDHYPATITITDKDGYEASYTLSSVNEDYNDEDEDGVTSIYKLCYGDENIYGYIYFYAAGTYTVTITINESSYSFDVIVNSVESYVYYTSSDMFEAWWSTDSTSVTTNCETYKGSGDDTICVQFYSEGYDSISVTLADTTLTADTDYYFKESGSFVYVYIYESILTLDTNNTVVVSLVSSTNGSAMITLTVYYRELSLAYRLSSDGTYYIVTGTGDLDSESTITIPSTYKDLPVKEIEEQAFYNNKTITSVVISDSVTLIGEWAFYKCTNLADVSLGSGVTYIGVNTFRQTAIKEIDLPEGLLEIGNYAFHTTNITTLTIPSTVTTIGEHITTSSLQEYVVAEGSLYFSTKDGVLYNADGTKLVEYPAGKLDDEGEILTEFEVPEGVTEIGNLAFMGTSLETIILPSTLTTIGTGAFYSSTSLATITVADGNTSFVVEDGVLYGINDNSEKISLIWYCPLNTATSFDVPETVTTIADYAFWAISKSSYLTTITLPEGLTYIGDYAFRNCTALTSINIPNTVTYIGTYAFGGCTALESITLPAGITEIYASTFYGCSKLTSIVIPDGVTSIGTNAFYSSGITSIVLPSSIESLDEYAFMNYYSAIYYYGTADELQSIEGYVDSYIWQGTIYYYDESGTASGYYWYYDESGKIVSGCNSDTDTDSGEDTGDTSTTVTTSYVLYVDTATNCVNYDSTDYTKVETDVTVYANIETDEGTAICVGFCAADAEDTEATEVSITIDGAEIKEDSDYCAERNGNYVTFYIYKSAITQNCNIIITVSSGTSGTATVVLNVTYNADDVALYFIAADGSEISADEIDEDTTYTDSDMLQLAYMMAADSFDYTVIISSEDAGKVYTASGNSSSYTFDATNSYLVTVEEEKLALGLFDDYNEAVVILYPANCIGDTAGTYTITITITAGDDTVTTTLTYVLT